MKFITCSTQRIHQSILNGTGTSTSTQSSSKNVLVTNPPVHFGFFWWTGQSTSPVQNTFWFLTLDKCNVGNFKGVALYCCIEMFLKTNWKFKTGRNLNSSKVREYLQFEGKIYKIGLEWIGLEKSNGTITISIHFQNWNGYPVHSWTGWTDCTGITFVK